MPGCDSVSLTRVKPAAREDWGKGFTEARGTDFGVLLGRRRVGKESSMASWRTAAAMADCDSVSLLRVKPAAKEDGGKGFTEARGTDFGI